MRLVSRGASPHHPIAVGLARSRVRSAPSRLVAGVAMLAATLCAALSLIALPVRAVAQESVSSNAANAGSTALADPTSIAAAAPETTLAVSDDDASIQLLNTRAHVVSMNGIALDDQVLARQRGGASGLTMVAATPQMLQGSGASVTLWDEIAPPAPLPVPVDSARAAQSNAASYLRR
jgi:hypothetical protein